jgi:hypothetical protein
MSDVISQCLSRVDQYTLFDRKWQRDNAGNKRNGMCWRPIPLHKKTLARGLIYFKARE